MADVAPGWKLRVLLAQALFSKPDVLLLDEPTNNLDINSIRWLEHTLNEYNSTMIIISHDRHFLNSVCTHMADMDFGTLKVWPGNYDDYMLASAQARERQAAANAREGARGRAAGLRAPLLGEQVEGASGDQPREADRQDQDRGIQAVVASEPVHSFRVRQEAAQRRGGGRGDHEEVRAHDLPELQSVRAAGRAHRDHRRERRGQDDAAARAARQLPLDHGTVKWAENANVGYMPQDTYEEFPDDITLMDWIDQYRKDGDDETMVRGTLGRLLFSADDIKKSVKVLSGGEKGRMIWGKLMLGRHNVLLMDEPTNHMDMESIESLQIALEQFEGTLIFVSHDREFVSGLANRIIEVRTDGTLFDFGGNYEEFLASQGQE
jgi:ATPase subunit of ABC transporter with duplicated ATPase domains